jgi:sulfur carrier protein
MIKINGITEELTAKNLSDLLREKDITPDKTGIAVALNNKVVPRSAWASTSLQANDHIEIITAIGGG